MISDGSVTDIKGLKGKQVAYEEGTTSDILLNYALSQNGMTIADIEKVPMPASDAGAALIGGKVPVAVTYEPYLTLAMNQNPKVKMVYSAGENPGLISDVFVVREEFLKEKPGQVVALLKAWDLALADYRKDTAGGRAIISEAIGAKPEELATAFDGVVYYSLAENKTELGGNFTSKVIPEAMPRRAPPVSAEGCRLEHSNRRRFVDARNKVRRGAALRPGWTNPTAEFFGLRHWSSPFWGSPGLLSQRGICPHAFPSRLLRSGAVTAWRIVASPLLRYGISTSIAYLLVIHSTYRRAAPWYLIAATAWVGSS